MSTSSNTYRITIIGAGIIGLTAACTLLKEYSSNNNFQLTIISETFSPETTADISAGLCQLYGIKDIDERMLRWANYTNKIFEQEYFSTKARAGIMMIPLYNLCNSISNDSQELYRSTVRHFRILDQYELDMFNHLNAKSGFSTMTYAVEVRKYLPHLKRYLEQDHRVKFIKKKIHSFVELKNYSDLIINCSGLNAKDLVGDQTVRPARGQVIRVYAPWIKSAYIFETDEGTGYIIPQADSVVLGGTFQLNDWNTKIDENDTRKILRMCSKCLPAIEQIHHGKIQVGLRPYRDNGVRLEYEKTSDDIDVIHCYGHSGSGVTLSWGCAKDVIEIVKNIFPINSQQDNNEDHLVEHEQLWRFIHNDHYILFKAKL